MGMLTYKSTGVITGRNALPNQLFHVGL